MKNKRKLFKVKREEKMMKKITNGLRVSLGTAYNKLRKYLIVKTKKEKRGRPKLKISKKKLLQLKEKGWSGRKIAKELKISAGTVYNRLRKYPEVKMMKEIKGGRPKKEIDKKKLWQLKNEGKTAKEIAKELKISAGTVYNRLRECGEE